MPRAPASVTLTALPRAGVRQRVASFSFPETRERPARPPSDPSRRAARLGSSGERGRPPAWAPRAGERPGRASGREGGAFSPPPAPSARPPRRVIDKAQTGCRSAGAAEFSRVDGTSSRPQTLNEN